MPEKEDKVQVISTPEVKPLLEKLDPEKADQIQKRTLDYVTKFSKLDPEDAGRLSRRLVRETSLTDAEAAELVNILPRSIEELRVFVAGWKKLIATETLEKILKILAESR